MPFNFQGVNPITRKVNDTGGVLGRRVVVAGTNTRECKNPAAANAGLIEGITLVGQDRTNGESVGVQTDGEAEVVAASAIAKDAKVNVADVTGRVKTVSEAAATVINQVGVAVTPATALGDIITVRLTKGEQYTA